jgi:hypothetical protein
VIAYRGHHIERHPVNGYWWCFSKDGRLMSDTLLGMKGLIRASLEGGK